MYHCTTLGCPIAATGKAFATATTCQFCDAPLTPVDAPTSPAAAAADLADLADLPFPVAYPLAHARDARLSAGDRLDNVIFTAYQAMRTATLVLLADYLDCDTVARELAGPMRGLRMPHWSEWTALAHKLTQLWRGELADRPERESTFPAVVAGWSEVAQVGRGAALDARWVALLGGVRGLQGQARSANDAIQRVRNDRAHRAATRTGDGAADEAERASIAPIVEEAVRTLFPPGSLQLVRRAPSDGDDLAFALIGPHEDLRFEAESASPGWSEALAKSSVIAVAGGRSVPIFPLLAPSATEGGPVASGGLDEPAALVESIKERSVVLLGVRSSHEAPSLVAATRERFLAKQVELALAAEETKPWTVVDWARTTAREGVEALVGRKYFPACYVERAGVDDRLDAALGRPGSALLLLGEAGAGKSSLLARYVDQLTSEGLARTPMTEADARSARGGALPIAKHLADRGQGDVVLFLSGRADLRHDPAKPRDQMLVDAICRKAGVRVGAFDSLERLAHKLDEGAKRDEAKSRRVVIVLDALNEAERYADFVESLDAFLPCVARYPWLRLVVSMRTGAYQALAKRGEDRLTVGGVFANERFFSEHLDTEGKPRPYLEIRPFRLEPEGREAYAKRQRAMPDRATTTPWTELVPGQRDLLVSPLRLHLFHETHKGREAPSGAIGERALFAAYLDELTRDVAGLDRTLADVATWMLDERRPDLALATADAWMAAWRARVSLGSAAIVARLDPVENLVAASVLMRPSDEGVGVDRRLVGYQFAHQKLCEAVLARELHRRIAPRKLPKADEMLAWARHAAGPELGEHDDFAELVGALEGVAAELAEAGDGTALAGLLELEDEPARTKILGAGLRALGPIWGASDQGDAGAAGCLRTIVDAAKTTSAAGERWVASSWESRLWLSDYGFSRVASAVESGRLSVLRRLVAAEPARTDLMRELSVSLNNLGNLARSTGRSDDARTFFEESLALKRHLVATEPDDTDLLRGLSVALNSLGGLARAAGRSNEARAYVEESLAIMRRLVAVEPGRADLQRELFASLNNLGSLADAGGRIGDACSLFDESLALMRRLVATAPERTDLLRDLAAALNNRGNVATVSSRTDEARTYFEEALALMRHLVGAEPRRADLRRDLSTSLVCLGSLARAAERLDDARAHFAESLALRRQLVAAEPGRTDLLRDLSATLNHLGNVAAASRHDDARPLFEESIAHTRRLIATDPFRVDLRILLARSCWYLHGLVATTDEKRHWLNEIIGALTPLRDAGEADERVERLWRVAQEAIAKV